MVDTLIIYAHPNKKSHSGFTLDEVTKTLKKEKVDFIVLDLYAMKFNPVLSFLEHPSSKKKSVSKDVKEMQLLISKANHFIVVHPIWWASGPAMLKGFFDRVFSGGFAFKYEPLPFPIFNLQARPIGLLKGKNAIVLSSMGGPHWYMRLFMGNRYAKSIAKDILSFCGVKTKTFFVDQARVLDTRSKEKIKKNVKKGLSWLFRD